MMKPYKSAGRCWPRLALLMSALSCASVKNAPEAEPVSRRAAGDDPTSVFKAPAKSPQKASEPAVSENERADFERAVAEYQKLKQTGRLDEATCEEAAAPFRRLAERKHDMQIARHNEAAVYLECGRREEGLRIEQQLASANYAPALASLGYAALMGGDTGQAESYFNRSIDADPLVGSVSARLNLAQILREKVRRSNGSERQNYANQALTQVRKVLAINGNSLEAYATLCFIYYDLALWDAVVLVGTQAIKRADEIASGKFDEEVATETVDRDRSSKSAKGRSKRDPEPKEKAAAVRAGSGGSGWTSDMKRHIAIIHNTLGLVALERKNYKDAIPNFKRAIDLDSSLAEARMNLATISLRFRDYDTAVTQFRAVVSAQPRNYDAAIGLGVALRGSRKIDEAEAQYQAAQKLDPSRPDSYFNLGILYQEYRGSEKASLQKAQQYYREYLGKTGRGSSSATRRDAEKRIKDIDELIVALEEAVKLQKEAEEIQRKAEEQQRKMEEEMKKQQDSEKATAPSTQNPASEEPAKATVPGPLPPG